MMFKTLIVFCMLVLAGSANAFEWKPCANSNGKVSMVDIDKCDPNADSRCRLELGQTIHFGVRFDAPEPIKRPVVRLQFEHGDYEEGVAHLNGAEVSDANKQEKYLKGALTVAEYLAAANSSMKLTVREFGSKIDTQQVCVDIPVDLYKVPKLDASSKSAVKWEPCGPSDEAQIKGISISGCRANPDPFDPEDRCFILMGEQFHLDIDYVQPTPIRYPVIRVEYNDYYFLDTFPRRVFGWNNLEIPGKSGQVQRLRTVQRIEDYPAAKNFPLKLTVRANPLDLPHLCVVVYVDTFEYTPKSLMQQ